MVLDPLDTGVAHREADRRGGSRPSAQPLSEVTEHKTSRYLLDAQFQKEPSGQGLVGSDVPDARHCARTLPTR